MSRFEIPSEYKCFPAAWKVLPFSAAIKDLTGGNPKVKSSDYLEKGVLAVVDQGQSNIAGYVDDETLACKASLPAIVFGDHTKTLKYIEQPFALGADGVKILEPVEELDKRFVFHYLTQLTLPDNAGYSRHFKFLKEKFIPLPPLPEQRRIAAILDKADALRRKRQQAIRLTEEFLRSVFLDMFGDPVTNPKGWEIGTIRDLVSEVKYGTSQKAGIEGTFPILRMGNITYRGGWKLDDLKYIDIPEKDLSKYLVENGDLLFNRTNSKKLVGKTAVFNQDQPMAYAGYLIRVRPNAQNTNEYISGYLNSDHGKKTLVGMCKRIIGMANINAQELQNIKILKAPLEEQQKYQAIVNAVGDFKNTLVEPSMLTDNLFNSLVQRAFRGEL